MPSVFRPGDGGRGRRFTQSGMPFPFRSLPSARVILTLKE
ncbi:hypothetical protein STXM2123_4159 [Streptomyces sp. F-3]|nr:hypothetical protein STXM2123_4159 [Streptomyces sp. F-3]